MTLREQLVATLARMLMSKESKYTVDRQLLLQIYRVLKNMDKTNKI